MGAIERLVRFEQGPLYKVAHFFLNIMGIEIPKGVKFPRGLGGVRFVHKAFGTVFHPKTEIGMRVQIYQGVTIGKARPWDKDKIESGCIVKDDAILCSGAKILFGETKLIVGEDTIIGANSVLTQSTGDWEIWAGVPARKVGIRERKK